MWPFVGVEFEMSRGNNGRKYELEGNFIKRSWKGSPVNNFGNTFPRFEREVAEGMWSPYVTLSG